MIWINKKLRQMREEEGFTLIELMVVVLIIAILIAIAIPTFLGARGRAQDRAVQSSLRNAVTNAKAIYTDNENYADATATLQECSAAATYAEKLVCAEPSLTFLGAGNADSTAPPNQISVNGDPDVVTPPAKSSRFIAAGKSANGDKCYFIQDRVNPSDNPGTWWALRDTPDGVGCNADAVATDLTFDLDNTPASGEWTKQPGQALV